MFNFQPKPKQMPGVITPQAKTIGVADRIGNRQAANQQGTSVVIYDSLPLDGRTEFNFFEGASSRAFPYTNMENNGGKLNVGETMVIEYAQLVFLTQSAPGVFTAIAGLDANLNFQSGEISFVQGNSQVLKRMKLQTWTNEFNKSSYGQANNVYYFNSLLTLQSLLEFTAKVRVPQSVIVANTFVQLILEGTGGILSPKVNF